MKTEANPKNDSNPNPGESQSEPENPKSSKGFFDQVIKWANESKESSESELNSIIHQHVESVQEEFGLGAYKLLFLLDDHNSIGSGHANKIYNALSKLENQKDIFLIIDSRGGSIESAYLISKTCRRLSKGKFIIGIPRRAKSAATLISLGADEIHMGLMSELGPIDPQIASIPALGLSNALRVVAELSQEYPGSAEMFSKYLKENLFLPQLGHLERMCESAEQYATRLLKHNSKISDKKAGDLANHFVKHYKDHGFVIDCDESQELLGEATVKINETEYQFANKIYRSLDFVRVVSDFIKHKQFVFIGDSKSGASLTDHAEEE
jgi:membrane-bound ClpP family serine protease